MIGWRQQELVYAYKAKTFVKTRQDWENTIFKDVFRDNGHIVMHDRMACPDILFLNLSLAAICFVRPVFWSKNQTNASFKAIVCFDKNCQSLGCQLTL